MTDYTLGPLEKWLREELGRRCELSALGPTGPMRAGCYVRGDFRGAGYGPGIPHAAANSMGAVMVNAHTAEVPPDDGSGEGPIRAVVSFIPRKRAAFQCLERAAEAIRRDAKEEAIGYLEACAAHVRALGGE